MAVKIRLKRMGKKAKPFYRLVVLESRWARDGKTIQEVGWYDPCKVPAQTSFKRAEIYRWLENGAQISDTVRSLLKKEGILAKFRSGDYKQELADGTADAKPAPVVEVAPVVEETAPAPVEETPTEEAPAEESKPEEPVAE